MLEEIRNITLDTEALTRALKAKRAINGYTQEDVAKALGMSLVNYILNREAKPENFKLIELVKLKKLFALETIDDIFFTN